MRTTLCAIAGAIVLLGGAVGHARDAGPRFVDELPDGVRVERIGRVRCDSLVITASIEENLARCRADLVDEAERTDADFIVIITRARGISFCNSCTRLGADLYRVVGEQVDEHVDEHAKSRAAQP